jgi:hypothetical protein
MNEQENINVGQWHGRIQAYFLLHEKHFEMFPISTLPNYIGLQALSNGYHENSLCYE